MMLAAMFILGYGPLDWSFPWWVWALAVLSTGSETGARHVK